MSINHRTSMANYGLVLIHWKFRLEGSINIVLSQSLIENEFHFFRCRQSGNKWTHILFLSLFFMSVEHF